MLRKHIYLSNMKMHISNCFLMCISCIYLAAPPLHIYLLQGRGVHVPCVPTCGIWFFPLPREFQASDSGHEAWQQVPCPAEPPHWSLIWPQSVEVFIVLSLKLFEEKKIHDTNLGKLTLLMKCSIPQKIIFKCLHGLNHYKQNTREHS